MPKKEKELNPELTEVNEFQIDKEEFSKLSKDMENAIFTDESEKDETFFKTLARQMNDEKNISMKTEYKNVSENFTGTKLEFLAKYGNMPYLTKWVKIFETKRVSLERKGRAEDVALLQERHREGERDKMRDLAKMFGVS